MKTEIKRESVKELSKFIGIQAAIAVEAKLNKISNYNGKASDMHLEKFIKSFLLNFDTDLEYIRHMLLWIYQGVKPTFMEVR